MKFKINKIFLWSLILIMVFGINIAFAAKGGNPLDVVWAAIADLQQQINNIQLIPGPTGPQGPSGPSGKGLKVIDTHGNNVGLFLDISSEFPKYENLPHIEKQLLSVFNTSTNSILAYEINSATLRNEYVYFDPYGFYYQSNNCTGNPYVYRLDNPYYLVKKESGFFKGTDATDIEYSLFFNSNGPGDIFGSCTTTSGILDQVMKVYPVAIPNFTGPLSIVEQ